MIYIYLYRVLKFIEHLQPIISLTSQLPIRLIKEDIMLTTQHKEQPLSTEPGKWGAKNKIQAILNSSQIFFSHHISFHFTGSQNVYLKF